MGELRFTRGRLASAAAVLALAGCVAPAAVSVSLPEADVVPVASLSPVATGSVAAVSAPSAPATPPELGDWRAGRGLSGIDVSRYQPVVDWVGLARGGEQFVYVKATEGTGHRSPTHDDQRANARAVGFVQGAYHYARPAQSSGTLQARFFHANGGAWSADGQTLPGALDLEFAETGDPCHGLEPSAMTAWVREFSDEYRRLSGRIPVIYTKAEVWDTCTDAARGFGDHPLWLFDHADVPGRLPTGWERPTLWQRGIVDDLDRNVFFGTRDQFVVWASAPLR